MTNKEYAKMKEFARICESVGIEPSKRQASKYKMGKGCVFKNIPYKGEERR